jgi:hypothetical protein
VFSYRLSELEFLEFIELLEFSRLISGGGAAQKAKEMGYWGPPLLDHKL